MLTDKPSCSCCFLRSTDKLEEEGRQISMLREENAALRSEVEEDREMISQLEEMTDQLRRQRIVHQASVLVGVLVGLWVCFCLAVYLSARVHFYPQLPFLFLQAVSMSLRI